MAIDPPNLEPPYDPVYDDLEVWKVKIEWDGDDYDVRYIPYIGYESHEMLMAFKREFHKEVMRYVGYPFPEYDDTYVYSRWSKDALLMVIEGEQEDTFDLVSSIPFYLWGNFPDRFGGYYKKDIIDWLKNNTERWCKIEVMNFWDIPEEKQKEIRSFIEEERAIEDYINRGGEL